MGQPFSCFPDLVTDLCQTLIMISMVVLTISAGILSTPSNFPFSMQLLQSQLPHEGSAVDFLGAECSQELYCHHNSHSCIALSNTLSIR